MCIFKSLIQRHKQADDVALATIIVHAFESVNPCARNPHPCRELQVYLLSRTDKSFGPLRNDRAPRAFQRVKAEDWLDKKGAWDNSYEATFGSAGWGANAQATLGQVSLPSCKQTAHKPMSLPLMQFFLSRGR